MTVRVIFICLGNICRSPMAEAVFQHLVEEAGLSRHFEIDSAGTSGWHVGDRTHPGTRQELARHGIQLEGRARRLQQEDVMDEETYLIAMDSSNLNDVRAYFGDHDRLFRLLDFSSQTAVRDVPDPYYSRNFAYVYDLIEDGCRGLLAQIRQEEGI